MLEACLVHHPSYDSGDKTCTMEGVRLRRFFFMIERVFFYIYSERVLLKAFVCMNMFSGNLAYGVYSRSTE